MVFLCRTYLIPVIYDTHQSLTSWTNRSLFAHYFSTIKMPHVLNFNTSLQLTQRLITTQHKHPINWLKYSDMILIHRNERRFIKDEQFTMKDSVGWNIELLWALDQCATAFWKIHPNQIKHKKKISTWF